MAEPSGDSTRRDRRIELFATILLAVAAVTTAWSSYQANRWNGEQVKASSRTNGLRIEAARAQGLAEAETEVDVATFIQWVDAYASDDETLQEFYETRFRDEFEPAFEAWIAQEPFDNPDAAPTPFRLPEYQLESKAEAERLDAASAASSAVVARNVQRSANYVLAVVMCAVALFFAGMSTKLEAPRLRIALLTAGWVVFVSTVIWVATSPVSVSV